MYRKRESSLQKHGDFIILDTICLQIAFILSYSIRHGSVFVYSSRVYRPLGLVTLLGSLVAGFMMNNYKNILRRNKFEELKKTVLVVSVVMMLDFTYLFMTQTSKTYSRVTLGVTWVLGSILVYTGRLLWKAYIRKQMRDKNNLRAMILVTTKDQAEKTLDTLNKSDYMGYFVSGIVFADSSDGTSESNDLLNGNEEHLLRGIPVVADRKGVFDYLVSSQVDCVYVDRIIDTDFGKALFDGCMEMGITVHYGINWIIDGQDSVIEKIGDNIVVTSSIRFADPRQLLIKRMMDIAGGIVGCIFTAVITVIIGPIIFIQSPGSIFFSQERVGQNGRIFRIYKFRSMYPDAEKRKAELMEKNQMKGNMFKIDDDPRIIPIGKFIRKTSLDEFPQFWNILKGDMSMVGTRPPTLDEYEKYELHHKARLATKPGLTGMWQVSGRNRVDDFEEIVKLDMKYIHEWNIWLDIKIILLTIKNIFSDDVAA